jgi:hypothetical protein
MAAGADVELRAPVVARSLQRDRVFSPCRTTHTRGVGLEIENL